MLMILPPGVVVVARSTRQAVLARELGESWYLGAPPGHFEVEPFLSYTELPPFGRGDHGFHSRRFGRLD